MNRFGLFAYSECAYAIPLERLERVLTGQRCYPLPVLPKAVRGAVVWDGQLIPLLDIARMWFDPAVNSGTAAYQVLINSVYGILALPAECNFGIVAMPEGGLVAAVETLPAGLCGKFFFQDRMFQILDIDYLANDLLQKSR